MSRAFSFLDHVISEVDHALKTLTVNTSASRLNPSEKVDIQGELNNSDKKLSGSLMRVDHTGEICAQALYRGQAFVAKSDEAREHLYHAADEEQDHLSWCHDRLDELGAHRSHLNPLWYCGSFAIGATAGMISDKLSYGFVMETENQVMQHLENHLERLPEADQKSRAILEQMRQDEAKHAKEAEQKGGVELPLPVKAIMKLQSKVMTTTAQYI